jgi:hypothetical protein
MPTFDVLRDEGPQLILCRHEQNAAFMAQLEPLRLERAPLAQDQYDRVPSAD